MSSEPRSSEPESSAPRPGEPRSSAPPSEPHAAHASDIADPYLVEPPAPSAPPAALDRSWSARLRAAAPDALVLLALLGFTLLVRIVRLPMIEVGGDAVKAWFNAKLLTYGLADQLWAWDHHSVRFAIIVPTWLVQEVLGTRPATYYVIPLAIAMLQVGLLWAIGRRLQRPLVGVAAAIAVCLFPQMTRAGSQILSEAPSGAYALLAAYFLLRYRDAPERRAWMAAAIAGALFIGYLTKITNVLFVPGFAIAVYLYGRRVRDVAIVAGLLLGLFLGETLLYRILTEHSLGQLSIISGSHLADRRLKPTELRDFFVHVADMTTYWKVTLGAFAASVVIALAGWRRLGRDPAVLAILAASFLLLQNFAVKSVSPLIPVQRFLMRYMLPALPLIMLTIAVVAWALVERIGARVKLPRWATPAAVAVALVASSLFVLGTDRRPADRHPFALLSRFEKEGNERFAKGAPVVGLTSPKDPTFFVRVLWNGLTGAKAPAKIPGLRKATHGKKRVHFVLHPKHTKEHKGKKDQAIFDSFVDTEVVHAQHVSAEGRDMGSLYDQRTGTLRAR